MKLIDRIHKLCNQYFYGFSLIRWFIQFLIKPKISFVMQYDPYDPFDEKYRNRLFNQELILAMRFLLLKGDIFIDAGAQKGYVTLHASHCVGKNGKVVSIEADYRSASLLKTNITMNDCKNVIIKEVALGEKNEIKKFRLSSQLGWSSFYPNDRNKHCIVDEQIVTVTTLDDIILQEIPQRDLDKITIIKIDCEGSELEILRGMRQLFDAISPVIWLEINTGSLKAGGYSEKDILFFLRSLNYIIFLPKLKFYAKKFPIIELHYYSEPDYDSGHRVFDICALKQEHMQKIYRKGIKLIYGE